MTWMTRALRTLVLLSSTVCLLGLLLGCATTGLSPTDALDGDTALARMQGTWRSVDDARAMIEISGDRMTDIYGGEEVGAGTIRWLDGCPDSGGEGLAFTVAGGEEDGLCYFLVRVDARRLEYSYSARGNTLRYQRVD
jgi:hypothetical protein